MLQAIRYSLANVANFNGRDARSTFWWYMLFLVIIWVIASLAMSMPMYVNMFSTAFDAVNQGADPEEVNTAMMQGISEQIRFATYAGTAVTLVMAALFSASFVRRLHDSGKSGWWLILALAPVIYTAIMSSVNVDMVVEMANSAMESPQRDAAMGDQTRLYFASVVGWLGYLVTIVFGVLESEQGPNQYGDQPPSFE